MNSLVLVTNHPGQVRTLIAHEPPAAAALPDRDAALAAARAVHETYMRSGFGASMAHFITLVSLKGPIPPDFFDTLRTVSTRIVFAAGAESEGEMANRGAHAVAERLGKTAETFPSDHGGFLGGEYGQTGDPDAFAAKLREVLTEN